MLKRIFRAFIIVACLLIAFLVGFAALIVAVEHNRWFATQCYTVIDEEPSDDGSDIWQYIYDLPCYTSQGRRIETSFSAPKVLRQNAFLRIYIKWGGVTAWEEVTAEDLPANAAEKLQ